MQPVALAMIERWHRCTVRHSFPENASAFVRSLLNAIFLHRSNARARFAWKNIMEMSLKGRVYAKREREREREREKVGERRVL